MTRPRIRRTTVVQMAVLLGFWLALSGRFEPLFVITGLVTAVVVTAVTHRIAGRALRAGDDHVPVGSVPVAVLRGAAFAFWMGGRILAASVQLAVIALSPQMPLDPCTVRFRTHLRRPIARAILANSISLVPGTLTVDIEGDVFTVHALAPNQVDDLITGRLQNKVAGMFLEEEQPAVHPSAIQEGDVR